MWDTVWPYGEVRSSLNAANSHRAHLTVPACCGSCDLQYVVPYKDCVFFPTEPGGQTRRRANPLETHKGARFTSRAARSCPVRQNVPITVHYQAREQRPDNPQVARHALADPFRPPTFRLCVSTDLSLREPTLQIQCERFIGVKKVSYAGLTVTYHIGRKQR